MTDSLLPPRHSGSNKIVLFLLVGGALMLAAAGVLFFMRHKAREPIQPPPAAPAVTVPAPLVEPTIQRPPLAQVDTASASAEEPEKTPHVAKVERTGTIDPEVVKGFFRIHEGELKACYERRLKNNSMLEGKLDLNIVVHSSGKVGAISRNADTMRDEEMFDCVKRTIRGWQFPKPEGGQVVIAKTFNFKKK